LAAYPSPFSFFFRTHVPMRPSANLPCLPLLPERGLHEGDELLFFSLPLAASSGIRSQGARFFLSPPQLSNNVASQQSSLPFFFFLRIRDATGLRRDLFFFLFGDIIRQCFAPFFCPFFLFPPRGSSVFTSRTSQDLASSSFFFLFPFSPKRGRW